MKPFKRPREKTNAKTHQSITHITSLNLPRSQSIATRNPRRFKFQIHDFSSLCCPHAVRSCERNVVAEKIRERKEKVRYEKLDAFSLSGVNHAARGSITELLRVCVPEFSTTAAGRFCFIFLWASF